MTQAELKTIVENTVNGFIAHCGALGNEHLSQSDFDEVVKPVATLAVLTGYASRMSNIYCGYAKMKRAYLKTLSLLVRNTSMSYIYAMCDLIDAHYDCIIAKIRDDDALAVYDLTVVVDRMIEEIEG